MPNPIVVLRDALVEAYGAERVDVQSFESGIKYCDEMVEAQLPGYIVHLADEYGEPSCGQHYEHHVETTNDRRLVTCQRRGCNG